MLGRSMARVSVKLSAMFGIAAVVASCSSDPVQSAAIKALGPEAPDVGPGEFHRAGQPCTVCHQKGGPGKGDFSIAGTIFFGPNKAVGVDEAVVRLVDSTGATRRVKTNCVGNFFIGRTEAYGGTGAWDPAFPVLVSVSKDEYEKDMKSLINREGSCAGCHRIPAGLDSPGHVFVGAAGDAPPPPKCPVSPIVSIQSGPP